MSALLRLLALAAILGLGLVTAPALAPMEAAPGLVESGFAPSASFLPLPQTSTEARGAIEARSPFAPDRSAYVRPAGVVMDERAPEVRLSAIASVGGVFRATLVIDGEELTVGEGDATVVGRVATIDGASIRFEESGLVLSLFR